MTASHLVSGACASKPCRAAKASSILTQQPVHLCRGVCAWAGYVEWSCEKG